MSIRRITRDHQFRQRLETLRPRLYRTAFAWTHNHHLAEDLVHDALAKGLRSIGQLRELEAMDAWLFRIMTNCWRDHLRRSAPTDEINESDLVTDRTPEQQTGEGQLIDQVRNAIATLSQGYRETLILVDVEGFSYVETATILSIPVGTVMSRLSRAREKVRGLLEQTASQRAERPALRRVK